MSNIDPFEGIELNQEFIDAARQKEEDATTRAERAARIRRNHDKLAAEGVVLQPTSRSKWKERVEKVKSPRQYPAWVRPVAIMICLSIAISILFRILF